MPVVSPLTTECQGRGFPGTILKVFIIILTIIIIVVIIMRFCCDAAETQTRDLPHSKWTLYN